MPAKRNPLKLNPLQLKTLTLLQELARHPEHATRHGEDGGVMVSQLPAPHGDHFHVGAFAVAARDATGLSNPAVFTALERKGLIRSLYPMGAVLTPGGLAYETGMREQILHGGQH
ncbi:MAG TPA: hypothetical protein VL244_08695 [Alphaproteobacteria bacterium]|nr:hypothetical protein [Alphaproteobacteria bacterium]